jgi:CBS domain-containing protein
VLSYKWVIPERLRITKPWNTDALLSQTEQRPSHRRSHLQPRDPLMDLARNLKIDSVSRLNPTAPLHVSPEQTVAEAVKLMRKEQVGCLLVCNDDRIVGLFTERDLMQRVMANGRSLTLPVQEVMTPNPVMVHPKDPIAVAIRRMEEGGYRHLPVVNEKGQPVGVLSVKRILNYLVEHFPATIYNLPPDPRVVPLKPEGA